MTFVFSLWSPSVTTRCLNPLETRTYETQTHASTNALYAWQRRHQFWLSFLNFVLMNSCALVCACTTCPCDFSPEWAHMCIRHSFDKIQSSTQETAFLSALFESDASMHSGIRTHCPTIDYSFCACLWLTNHPMLWADFRPMNDHTYGPNILPDSALTNS